MVTYNIPQKGCTFLACKANPATKVKVTEAMRMRGYLDLETKEMTNMTGRRRGLLSFEVMKMRTEEELAACGSGGGAGGRDSCGVRIQQLVIIKDATIILLFPPLPSHLLLPEKGGGLDSDSTGMREDDGLFPPSPPPLPPFPYLPSPQLSSGHSRQ